MALAQGDIRLEQIRFDRDRLPRLAEAAIFGGVADLLNHDAQGSLWELVEPLSFADPYLAGWLPDALAHGDVATGPFGFMRLRTATVSMSTNTFRKVGGFDPAMRSMEDWELGVRCQNLGVPIVSAPEIEAYHQLHAKDNVRSKLFPSTLSHFEHKHRKVFNALRSNKTKIDIPGINIIRGRTADSAAPSRRTERPRTTLPFLALTFDDSPHPVITPRLLELFTSTCAKATFFVMGSRAVRYPEIVRDISNSGCEVGVYGWDYSLAPEQTSEEIVRDLRRATDAISRIAGSTPRFCRPQFGEVSAGYLNAAAKLDLCAVVGHASLRHQHSSTSTELLIELATHNLVGKVLMLQDGVGDPDSMTAALGWLLASANKNGIAALTMSEAQKHMNLPTLRGVNLSQPV